MRSYERKKCDDATQYPLVCFFRRLVVLSKQTGILERLLELTVLLQKIKTAKTRNLQRESQMFCAQIDLIAFCSNISLSGWA